MWFGLNAPAGTPGATVDRLAAALAKVLANPEVRQQLTDQTINAVGGTPAQFAAAIARESAQWSKVISTAGIKIH